MLLIQFSINRFCCIRHFHLKLMDIMNINMLKDDRIQQTLFSHKYLQSTSICTMLHSTYIEMAAAFTQGLV